MTYTVTGDSNSALFDAVALDAANGIMVLTYAAGQTGESVLTVTATDSGGLSVPSSFTVRVLAPATPQPQPGPGPQPQPPAAPGAEFVGESSLFGRLVGKRRGRRPAGVAAAQVFLDANDNGVLDVGEPAAMTGADGTFAFAGLAARKYTVQVGVPAGWAAGGVNGRGAFRKVTLHARRHKPVRVKPLVLRPSDALV